MSVAVNTTHASARFRSWPRKPGRTLCRKCHEISEVNYHRELSVRQVGAQEPGKTVFNPSLHSPSTGTPNHKQRHRRHCLPNCKNPNCSGAIKRPRGFTQARSPPTTPPANGGFCLCIHRERGEGRQRNRRARRDGIEQKPHFAAAG